MPEDIIKKFKKKYGKKKGKQVYYATANKQKRSKETFRRKRATESVQTQDVPFDRFYDDLMTD